MKMTEEYIIQIDDNIMQSIWNNTHNIVKQTNDGLKIGRYKLPDIRYIEKIQPNTYKMIINTGYKAIPTVEMQKRFNLIANEYMKKLKNYKK